MTIHCSATLTRIMKCPLLISLLFVCLNCFESISHKSNPVLVVLLARNKEHTLPYFLSLFDKLDYPKKQLSLYIRSDCNVDRTIDVLQDWITLNEHLYHSFDTSLSKTKCHKESETTKWTLERFTHVIWLKNEAFRKGRYMWANYIWFLDVDVLLVDEKILHNLINKNKGIVGPMLNSLGTYSNFWGGMTKSYWYERTEEYFPILDRKKMGCFPVPMVHSSVLVDLTVTLSDKLSFNPNDIPGYNGPIDDIIAFAVKAKNIGMELHVCNDVGYGIIPPPLNEEDTLTKDFQQMTDVKLSILVDHAPLTISNELSKYIPTPPQPDMLGFDNIYLVNLQRRTQRRERMVESLKELHLDYEWFHAVDGQFINESYLQQLGVEQMVGFKDPWSKRDMTYGEIGCFLSHYFIWVDMVRNSYEKVIIFEDDIRFEPYFRAKVKYLVNQASQLQLKWDLVYLGRKKLKDSDEPWVDQSDILIHVDYSYWTLCYMLTLDGAKKLLQPNPLEKMVPVDEYIPIMFNKHPQTKWMERYSMRNLKAYSASPLLVHPTHYTGENGYISDTEASSIIDNSEEMLPNIQDAVPVARNGANSHGAFKEEL